MKTIKKYLKVVALFFAILILFQGCTVYKSASVTLDEASKYNTKVRIKTSNNQSLKFKRIEVINNKFYGVKMNNRLMNRILIVEDNIEKIQLKDKSTSTILTIAIPVVVVGVLGILVAESLNSWDFGPSN